MSKKIAFWVDKVGFMMPDRIPDRPLALGKKLTPDQASSNLP
jgi:hypothetical protein